ncbi:DUF6456 domain-containing protein [Devosia sp. Root635]|uniref:DUF6456 domain-containing protein n=1 Tax=Devosia sp. Root635 TaxID=1736575 RepID=UPI0006FE697A|nr:DUF6456 domain-containing protein [Devosia sp. Root635]KRA55813.1 hypothetical protein ASD80_00575 [Devosia sp. Root635]
MPPSTRDDDALARLGASRVARGPAFLGAHHLLAAERLEQLIRRAQLAPRVTMSYNPAAVGGGGRAANGVETASQGAADARLRLSRIAADLPADCWGVLFDVCGLGKGLQLVETERRWPRRSAKLVLRIGLDQLASQFGLRAQATGPEQGRALGWLGERLPLIADAGS